MGQRQGQRRGPALCFIGIMQVVEDHSQASGGYQLDFPSGPTHGSLGTGERSWQTNVGRMSCR
jgi:hypothetical protein